jgi:hypothetical protein
MRRGTAALASMTFTLPSHSAPHTPARRPAAGRIARGSLPTHPWATSSP